MSKEYYQIKFVGVATIEAEDDFEAGRKFKDLEIDMPNVDVSDIEVLDI